MIFVCTIEILQRCVPLRFVISLSDNNTEASKFSQSSLTPQMKHHVLCPFCGTASIYQMDLLPMTIEMLDRAVEAKKKASAKISNLKSIDGIGVCDSFVDEIQAESTYLLVTHSGTNMSSSTVTNNDSFRTGRWTDEEMEYVDFLIEAYDLGILPVPVGIRLNDFLCSLLLCKASRLTKKMKNARLSVRAYEVDSSRTAIELDTKTLSALQEKFLRSIVEDGGRLELRFNIEKTWRTSLSNLCVQVGSSMLNATAWIASLEEMDNRAALADENIRKARRRQMGLALKTDVGASDGVFFSGVPVQRSTRGETADDHGSIGSQSRDCTASHQSGDTRHISNMLDIGEDYTGIKDSIDDFAGIFNDLLYDVPMTNMPANPRNECGSFLEQVLSYVSSKDMPFDHVDVWVPSYVSQTKSGIDNLRLYHAGHVTRSDLDAGTYLQLYEYGEYSTKFSFAPGVGLPGRVYQSGHPSWERHIDEADPKIFERAGGAKVYGVKTGVGIPMDLNTTIGRMVVALYSKEDIEVNEQILNQLSHDLMRFCPNPKWKLVVEMGANTEESKNTSDRPDISEYHQGSSPVFEPRSNPFASTSNSGISVKVDKKEEVSSSSRQLPDIIHYHHGENQAVAPSVSSSSLNMLPPTKQRKVDIAQYHPAGTSPQIGPGGHPVSSKAIGTERVRSSSLSSTHSDSLDGSPREEEIRIAALLGDHMPGAEVPSTGEPTGSMSHAVVGLAHFMSLRLLLLRLPERRTDEENALLDIIKRSYHGFSRDANRSSKEVASLLVNDWQYLTSSSDAKVSPRVGPPAVEPPVPSGVYQSYMLSAPPVTTQSSLGAPISMPPLRLAHTELSSAEDGMFKKRRISGDE